MGLKSHLNSVGMSARLRGVAAWAWAVSASMARVKQVTPRAAASAVALNIGMVPAPAGPALWVAKAGKYAGLAPDIQRPATNWRGGGTGGGGIGRSPSG
jgi:hypothetical protein